MPICRRHRGGILNPERSCVSALSNWSGHTLSASIVWPSVAGALRARWAWAAALIVVLLVSVSRVYLGVHFVSDVVAAWGVAAARCWSFGWAERLMSGWLAPWSLGRQMALAL